MRENGMVEDVRRGMGRMYQGRPRTCGFRFSKTDAAILLGGGGVTCFLFWNLGVGDGMSLLPVFVVGHFFLFCNIFRVRRPPELVWASTFLLNVAVVVWGMDRSFLFAYGLQLLVTAWVIGHGLRHPSYHGVWARRFNRRHIEEYLSGDL